MCSDKLYYLKNNKIERKEKIIAFGLKDRLNLMKNSLYNEYFLDITFKIIPKCYRPYKLLTIASIDKENCKAILICFVLFVYMDGESFLKIFEYLFNNYNFNLIILHSDYEKGFQYAIKKAKFFKENIIHVNCSFHFIKSVREKLKKYTSNNNRYISKLN